jgi:hypothetical protein
MFNGNERSIDFDSYTLYFPPSTLTLPRGHARVAIHILKPGKRILNNPRFLVILTQNKMEEYPIDIVHTKNEIIFVFDIELEGSYTVIEKGLFTDLRASDLEALARKFEIEGRSKMVKQELIEVITKVTKDKQYSELKKIIDQTLA